MGLESQHLGLKSLDSGRQALTLDMTRLSDGIYFIILKNQKNDIKIPSWMVPTIKEMIMKSELSFMLQRPSDDSNNATIANVKPHGPQDQEE